jgi:hypothetical protein
MELYTQLLMKQAIAIQEQALCVVLEQSTTACVN